MPEIPALPDVSPDDPLFILAALAILQDIKEGRPTWAFTAKQQQAIDSEAFELLYGGASYLTPLSSD